jgi:AcrR family transcriptional regulator
MHITLSDIAMDTPTPTKQRGRPPAFNHEEALEKAMHVFWAHGYEGASMSDLTEALGVNKPSIYGAFGSKEELFRKTLQRYVQGPAAFVGASLQEPTAYRVAEALLLNAARFLTAKDHPPGCMVTQGALACGQGSEIIKQELASSRNNFVSVLTARFARAKAENDLPADADPAALARLLATMHQGMAVQAASGASEEELLAVARLALESWPGKRD